MLVNACVASRIPNCFLYHRFVKMMTADETRALIFRKVGGGKQVLPDPVLICIPILTFKSQGEIDKANAICEVFLVDGFYMVELKLEGPYERVGKDGQAVILALSIADHNLMVVKIDVLYTQAHRFHYAKPTAVHHLSDQFGYTSEIGEKAFDFFLGEDGGNGFGALRAELGKGKFVEFDLKNIAIQEEDGAECLILSGCGDFPTRGKMGEELSNFGESHVFRVTFTMIENVVSDPENIGIFGARGIAFDAQSIAILIEKFFTRRGCYPFQG